MAVQSLVLPCGEIAVLDRQVRQHRGHVSSVRGVQRTQLAIQQPHRPTVGDEVVNREDEDVVFVRESQQAGAEQWSACQIERLLNLNSRCSSGLLLTHPVIDLAKIDNPDLTRLHGIDSLARFVANEVEGCAKRLVTPRDFGQSVSKRAAVERTPDAETSPQVVRGVALPELRLNPERLLGK